MTKNTIKTIIMVVAILLVLALAGGWIAQAVVSKQKEPVINQAVDNAKDGMQVELENNDSGIQFMSARIATEDYEEYGVSALAESAYTINATVTPSNAPDKTLKWALSFANPSSSWANGKSPSDYVTLTSAGTQATLSCKQAFGEPIIVTATSTVNTSKSAQCRLNYKQRITGATLSLHNMTFFPNSGTFLYNNGMKLGECRVYPTFTETVNASYSIEMTKSNVYTKPADEFNVRFEMIPTSTLISQLEKKGYSPELPEYVIEASSDTTGVISHYFDISWAESIVGDSLTTNIRNYLITDMATMDWFTAYTLNCYIGDETQPVYSYGIFLDFDLVQSSYDIDSVSFDKTEIDF